MCQRAPACCRCGRPASAHRPATTSSRGTGPSPRRPGTPRGPTRFLVSPSSGRPAPGRRSRPPRPPAARRRHTYATCRPVGSSLGSITGPVPAVRVPRRRQVGHVQLAGQRERRHRSVVVRGVADHAAGRVLVRSRAPAPPATAPRCREQVGRIHERVSRPVRRPGSTGRASVGAGRRTQEQHPVAVRSDPDLPRCPQSEPLCTGLEAEERSRVFSRVVTAHGHDTVRWPSGDTSGSRAGLAIGAPPAAVRRRAPHLDRRSGSPGAPSAPTPQRIAGSWAYGTMKRPNVQWMWLKSPPGTT